MEMERYEREMGSGQWGEKPSAHGSQVRALFGVEWL